MSDDLSMYGVSWVGVLRRSVEKGAAAEAGGADVCSDVRTNGTYSVLRRPVIRSGLLETVPEETISLLEIGDHQVRFTREVAVERRPGRAGLRQDPIDRHRVQPFCVEDPTRGVE